MRTLNPNAYFADKSHSKMLKKSKIEGNQRQKSCEQEQGGGTGVRVSSFYLAHPQLSRKGHLALSAIFYNKQIKQHHCQGNRHQKYVHTFIP